MSPQSPESARSVETFTVGLMVGSYNGGGSVDITSKMAVVHLGPLAERFAGHPSFVQHGGQVVVATCRLAPPWMSVRAALAANGDRITLSLPIFSRRRFVSVLSAQWFDVAENRRWLRFDYSTSVP